jgi:flagellar M-ring protein FliF
MASIDRPSSRVAFERLRARLERLWRPIASARPAVRWGLAAVVLLALGAASYWGASNLSPSGVRYLASGKRFSSEALITVGRALEKQRIAYRIDDLRRVEVASDQFEEAADAVAKLDLGPPSIEEIRKDSQSAGLFDGPIEREQKEKVKLERMLEKMISDQEGVLSAVVSIDRPRAQAFSRNSAKPSAFVYVETDKGRAVPSRSVQAILGFLDGMVPGLEPGSITVMDHRGMRYLDPGNPALGDHSRNRAREEEISEEILEKLDWIKGVRVQVQVITPHAGELAATKTSGAGRPGADTTAKGARPREAHPEPGSTHAGGIDERPRISQPEMAVNRPISLEGGGELSPAVAPPAVGSGGSATAQRAAAKSEGIPRATGEGGTLAEPAPHTRTGDASKERGWVVVNVPRSFYLNMEIRGDQGKPSLEELRVMAERTEKSIRTTIALLLPDSDSWKVEVGTFADDVAQSRPTVLPDPSDSRQRLLEWGILGAVGGGLLILAIAGSVIHLARRPARLPVHSAGSRRYHAGSVLQPSPSERVRELIQRNPEAAASVLQRWVGQGGRSS